MVRRGSRRLWARGRISWGVYKEWIGEELGVGASWVVGLELGEGASGSVSDVFAPKKTCVSFVFCFCLYFVHLDVYYFNE